MKRKKLHVLVVLNKFKFYPYSKSMMLELIEKNYNLEILSFEEHYFRKSVENELKVRTLLGIKRSKGLIASLIYNFRVLHGVILYNARTNQSAFYKNRWKNHLGPKIRNWSVQLFDWIKYPDGINFIFRKIESLFPVYDPILKQLKKINPDIVFVSPGNFQTSFEVDYLKAANSLKIPTYISVLSWDNLTTKGAFSILAKKFLMWNKTHKDEALKYHSIPREIIEIHGAMFFDKWKGPLKLYSKQEHLKTLGLDKNQEYLLYLGSSVSVAPDDRLLISSLSEALSNASDPQLNRLKIILRAHPSNFEHYENLNLKNVVVYPTKDHFPDGHQKENEFYNTIKHSLLCVTINTSAIIDAIIQSHTCVCILPKERQHVHIDALHFQALLKYNVTHNVSSIEQLLLFLRKYIDQKVCRKNENIKVFLKDFIWPLGNNRAAGKTVAKTLENSIHNV